jgi:hypothetical protein
MAMMGIEEVQIGWSVYDSSGDKIGDVAEVMRDHIRVKKSGLLGGTCYVPASAVENVEEHGVYLNAPKSEVGKWGSPPQSSSGS